MNNDSTLVDTRPPVMEATEPTTMVPPVLDLAPPVLEPSPKTIDSTDESDLKALKTPVRRWKKRTLLVVCGLTLAATVLWATSPRPRLLKSANEIPGSFETSVHQVASQVDAAMQAKIDELGLPTAPRADWRTIARRTSLAMVGNGLSLEEIRAIEQIPEDQRTEWWGEYLLSDRRWADYFAERWTRATVGTNDGPFLVFRRRKYRQWLSEQLSNNTPYDAIVRSLIVSRGSWTDAPQVNFLTATMDEGDKNRPDPIRLAGRTSRAFLAMRIDCLQCHQDYLGNVKFLTEAEPSTADAIEDPASTYAKDSASLREGQQSDFHQLAAFFAGIKLENPFAGLQNIPLDYRVTYQDEEESQSVKPLVPYLRELTTGEGNPREQLAAWITHRDNKAFARATVNRLWALMFGRPLVEPVDNIPLTGPYPPGLEILAEDFAAHGFDMKRLIRIVLCTKVFQRDSKLEALDTLPSENDDDTLADKLEDHWAIFPITQLRPEQVAASIHQACRIKVIDEASSILTQLELFTGVNDFTKAYGDRGDDEFNEQSVSIPQRLLVMNGFYVSERVKHDPLKNASTHIAQLVADDTKAIEIAYLSVLNRLPSQNEREAFASRLVDKKGMERSQAMSNLFWVLINSTEFQWNH